MVKCCCVKDCSSEWSPGTDLSFHSFPKNEEIRQKWIEAIPNSEERVINWKHATICSIHFTEDCFNQIYHFTLRNQLRKDAVPTLFGEDTVPEYVDLEELSELSGDENDEDDPLPAAQINSKNGNNLLSLEQSEEACKKDISVQTSPQKRTIEEVEEEYKKRETDLRKRLKKAEMKIQHLESLLDMPDERSETNILEEIVQKYVPEDRNIIRVPSKTQKNDDYDVKDFAITTYLFCPQAYDDLREKMILPPPSALRKWLR